jgi:multiple sugar transport system ATP-binding protein
VIVGIRAEDFEDAALVPDGRQGATITAVVDVLESTGSDVFAHIARDHEEVAAAQRAAAALNPDARDVPLPSVTRIARRGARRGCARRASGRRAAGAFRRWRA